MTVKSSGLLEYDQRKHTDYELFSLQENLFHRTNMEMNIIMVDTVYFDMGAWCIISVCGVSAWIQGKQFYRGEVVFSGTLYVGGGCPS